MECFGGHAKESHNNHKHKFTIPLVNQNNDWDCGLACASMILQAFHKPDTSLSELISEEIKHESIWTIDLAFLLKKYGVPFTYYTITIGAKKEYAYNDFYKKDFVADEKRVNELFEKAAPSNITIIQKSLPFENIKEHLAKGGLIIALVNSANITCHHCQSLTDRFIEKFCASTETAKDQFSGHYIVVEGYDESHQKIFYKDPSATHEQCSTSVDNFEKARKSEGTDEDLLFIFPSEHHAHH